MAYSTADLRAYVNAPADTDTLFLDKCLSRARALLAPKFKGDRIPAEIQELAVQEVAADLYNRRGIRNGIATFETMDGAEPIRIRKNPLEAANDILAPYLGPAIA